MFPRASLSQKNDEVVKLNESLESHDFVQLKNDFEEVTANYAFVVTNAVDFSKLVMDSVPMEYHNSRMVTFSKFFNDNIAGSCYQKFCKVLFLYFFFL